MFIDKIPNFQIFMNGGAIKPPYDSQVLLWMRYFVDSAGLIVGMCAMIMMLLRVREQWFLWLIIDIVTLILHCIVTNTQMICAFAVSLINAFYGIITWGVFKKK
jgi:nicotinamide mononucleotide transporter PnuC